LVVPAGLFFTGTDTGVGKTYITARVARLLRNAGRPVRVSKPVATGASAAGPGRWVAEDTLLLAEAAGCPEAWDEVTPFAFPEPAAPPIAAKECGVTLELADLVDAVRRQHRPGTALLVEGVGGLLCPLTERETVADLAAELRLSLVVIARTALGTINHTLLTLEVARGRGLAVAGVVLSETVPGTGLAHITVFSELRRRIAVPLLAAVPFRLGADSGNQPELAAVDWWSLCQASAT
jgi:dethiobiotin synthetase